MSNYRIRIEGAHRALAANAARTNTDGPDVDPHSALRDLLTNLRHWCKRNRVDFDSAVFMSGEHFSAETKQA